MDCPRLALEIAELFTDTQKLAGMIVFTMCCLLFYIVFRMAAVVEAAAENGIIDAEERRKENIPVELDRRK